MATLQQLKDRREKLTNIMEDLMEAQKEAGDTEEDRHELRADLTDEGIQLIYQAIFDISLRISQIEKDKLPSQFASVRKEMRLRLDRLIDRAVENSTFPKAKILISDEMNMAYREVFETNMKMAIKHLIRAEKFFRKVKESDI